MDAEFIPEPALDHGARDDEGAREVRTALLMETDARREARLPADVADCRLRHARSRSNALVSNHDLVSLLGA
jgi:hypothetical protein